MDEIQRFIRESSDQTLIDYARGVAGLLETRRIGREVLTELIRDLVRRLGSPKV